MAKHYPLKFTLEDGADVEVNEMGKDTYEFSIRQNEGAARHFRIIDDGRPKDQIVEALDFDQLNAVRRFWLEKDDLV